MNMASTKFFSLFILFLFVSSLGVSATFATQKAPRELNRKQKVTQLHFYLHDIIAGPNATLVQVAGPNTTEGTGFGFVAVFDDVLTEGPEITSKSVGRAQGMYVSSGLQVLGLTMTINLGFTEGKYNGSSISILGKSSAIRMREMPIVGGSGLFRFARGYALVRTYFNDANTGNSIAEYNVYVMHY